MENKILKLLLVFICTIVAGTMIYFNLTVEIPVFKTAVSSGTTITADMVGSERIMKSQITDDFYQSGMDLIGKSTTVDIAANIPVAKALTEEPVKPSVDIDNSKVAIVPIPVKPENIPSDLKKGDLVNVLVYFDSSVADGDAFVIGYNYIATVSDIIYDESGKVSKIDCIFEKSMATDISASVSMGTIYIIKNEDINSVELNGATVRELFNKYYNSSAVVEDIVEETIEPETKEGE